MNTGVGIATTDAERSHVEEVRKQFEEFRERHNYSDVNIDTVTTLDTVRHFLGSIEAHNAADDRYLRAAFWICWLVKFKPAYLRHGNHPLEEINKKYSHYHESGYNSINENFALGIALDILEIEPYQVSETMRERFVDMLYRGNLDPSHLALTLEMLCESVAATKRAEYAEAQIAKIALAMQAAK